ncbi:MAG TPA: hypothetical protein VMW83_16905 [Spirochaetia bacterium]|nr:hypothetical protein [Spirochaetia bacterium]
MRDYRDIPRWASVKPEEWQDWRWQLNNRLTSTADLREIIELTATEEQGIAECLENLRMAITHITVP